MKNLPENSIKELNKNMKSPESQPDIYEDLSTFVASKKESGDKLVEAYNDKILDIYSDGLDKKLEELSGYLDLARNDEKMESKIEEIEALLEQIKLKQSTFDLVWDPGRTQFNDRTKALAIKKQINLILSQINPEEFIEYTPARKLAKNVENIANKLQLKNRHYELSSDGKLIILKNDSIDEVARILIDPENEVQKLTVRCGSPIDSDDFSTLAPAFKHEKNKIIELDLSQNKVGDKGVVTLIQNILHSNCKLQDINLDGNGISENGARNIIYHISKSNSDIKRIDLRNNISSKDLQEAIKQRIRNANLKVQIEV